MATKILAKAEAVRRGYLVAHGLGDSMRDRCRGTFAEEWHGKWRATSFSLNHPQFRVSASRWKHSRDGRIRDAVSNVEGQLWFARWLIESGDDDNSELAKGFRDARRLLFSLEDKNAKRFAKPMLAVGELSLEDAFRILDEASVYSALLHPPHQP